MIFATKEAEENFLEAIRERPDEWAMRAFAGYTTRTLLDDLAPDNRGRERERWNRHGLDHAHTDEAREAWTFGFTWPDRPSAAPDLQSAEQALLELITPPEDLDRVGDWIFTFGPVHVHPETGASLRDHYVRFRETTWGEARKRMLAMFGNKWSHQSPGEKAAEYERDYGTKELPESQWPGAPVRPAVMKTREEVLAGIDARARCIDGRDRIRLAAFLPITDWDAIGVSLSAEGAAEPRAPRPGTREGIVEQMRVDVAFGFEKALDKRGISAGLMHEVVKMWLWVLGDPLAERDDYAQYGLPLFKATAVKYGFPNPIGDDTGREHRYSAEGG